MANPVLETGNITRLTATGTSVVTSGNAYILGWMVTSSITGGVLQFFAGATTSASLSPTITVGSVSTTAAAAFVRYPASVSGSGLTVKYTGTLDPNLVLFWLPMGGP